MRRICARALLASSLCAVAASARPSYPGPGGSIPDNNPSGFQAFVNVPDSFTVGSVSIQFQGLHHTWCGDLRFTLMHGPSVFVFFDRPGVPPTAQGNSDDFSLGNVYMWDDAGIPFPENPGGGGTIPSGAYAPGQATGGIGLPFVSQFAGQNSAGDWTLVVTDNDPGDIGNIAGWTLTLNPAGPVVTDVAWAAPVNGSWNTPGNWNPAVVPNNSGPQQYNATIGIPGGPFVATLASPITINALTLTSPMGALDLAAQMLTVEGNYVQNGTSTLQATPWGPASIIVHGDANFFAGNLMYVPMFITTGGVNFLGSPAGLADAVGVVMLCDSGVDHNGTHGKWTNNTSADGPADGALDVNVAPTILLQNSSVFDNGDTSTFLIESDANMQQTSMPLFTSMFNNRGILRKQTTGGVTTMTGFVFNNTGTVEVASGTLVINGVPVSGNVLSSGTWIVRNACSLDLAPVSILFNQANITLDGVTAQMNSLNALRSNAGSLTVRSGKQYTTNPSINLLTNSGQLLVGPGSKAGVTGTITLQSTGNVNLGLNGAASFANYGRISATNAINFSGALTITLESGFMPDWGDTYVIATYASRTVNFTTFNLPALSSPNLRWWKENNPTNYRVGVRDTADTNHDNTVNFADLNNVLSQFGQNGAGLIGDCDEDGHVNFTDLNLVLSRYGQSAPPN